MACSKNCSTSSASGVLPRDAQRRTVGRKATILRLKNSSREEFGSGGWFSITSAHRVRSWPASDRAMTIAWRASGTRRGRFISMVAAGTIRPAFSKSISFQRASRSSPGAEGAGPRAARQAGLSAARCSLQWAATRRSGDRQRQQRRVLIPIEEPGGLIFGRYRV